MPHEQGMPYANGASFLNVEHPPVTVRIRDHRGAITPWPVFRVADAGARFTSLHDGAVNILYVSVERGRAGCRGGRITFADEHHRGFAVAHLRVAELAVSIRQHDTAYESKRTLHERHRRGAWRVFLPRDDHGLSPPRAGAGPWMSSSADVMSQCVFFSSPCPLLRLPNR